MEDNKKNLDKQKPIRINLDEEEGNADWIKAMTELRQNRNSPNRNPNRKKD